MTTFFVIAEFYKLFFGQKNARFTVFVFLSEFNCGKYFSFRENGIILDS